MRLVRRVFASAACHLSLAYESAAAAANYFRRIGRHFLEVSVVLITLEEEQQRFDVLLRRENNIMGNNAPRVPLLVRHYERFLDDQDSSNLVRSVAERYTAASLERIATCGDRLSRRAAILMLGYIGEYESNPVLGRALVDRDRGVRTLAESAIRNVWTRVGSSDHRQRLRAIARTNQAKQYDQAVELATRLIHESPWIAEAWCHRGTSYYHLGQYDAAIRDCHQALEINPYHFTAAAGMGQCYLLQNKPTVALEAFRKALRLNPSMEEVRAQVIRLQKSLNNGA